MKKTVKKPVKKPASKRKPLVSKQPVGSFRVNVGGYGHQAEADRAAAEFLHPAVFRYQSVYFPLPENFGITAKITEAKVYAAINPDDPRTSHAIRLTIVAEGDTKKVNDWKTNVLARMRTKLLG
jgi:hypothetical protein